MKEHQLLLSSFNTPNRDLSAAATTRRSSLSSSSAAAAAADLTKKAAKKSLKSALASVAAESSVVDLSPVSEVLDDDRKPRFGEVIDSESTAESKFICDDLIPLGSQGSTEISVSSEASTLSDVTNSSDRVSCIAEKSKNEVSLSETSKFSSVEAYVVADHLKQGRVQIMKSNDVDDGMKKLVDALIDVRLKELYAVPYGKEKGKYRVESNGLVRVCFAIVNLMLLIAVWAVAVAMMFGADDRDPWRIPPT